MSQIPPPIEGKTYQEATGWAWLVSRLGKTLGSGNGYKSHDEALAALRQFMPAGKKLASGLFNEEQEEAERFSAERDVPNLYAALK